MSNNVVPIDADELLAEADAIVAKSPAHQGFIRLAAVGAFATPSGGPVSFTVPQAAAPPSFDA